MQLMVRTPLRGTDPGGSGHFGASRGRRLHMGVDFAAAPDSVLLSPVTGKVTKHGYPYSDDLSYRYIQIVDKNGWRHRFFYVDPIPVLDSTVEVGDEIGKVQDISTRYPVPKGMKCHIHYEIIDKNGNYVEPGKE